MDSKAMRHRAYTMPASVWLEATAEEEAGPCAVEAENFHADRLASAWAQAQAKIEAQCSRLCETVKTRDDELVKRMEDCLRGQIVGQQESTKHLQEMMAAQQAQWDSMMKELARHLDALRDNPLGLSPATSTCDALSPRSQFAPTPPPPQKGPTGDAGPAALAGRSWHEAQPPETELPMLPAAIPAEVPAEDENPQATQEKQGRSSEEWGARRFSTSSEESDLDDVSELDDDKAYARAKIKAERMLALRTYGLSKVNLDKVEMRTNLKNALESWWGEGLCAFVIFTNCIVIGVETDFNSPSKLESDVFQALDSCYTMIFFLELCARLGAYGGSFFWSRREVGLFWNYLDMLIVIPSMIQLIVRVFWQSEAEYGGSMTVVRILRITRVFRVIRVVKVMKFIRSLRQLVESIMHTMKSLAWSMLLLVAIIYVFAIMFTDATVAYVTDNPSSALNVDLTREWGHLHASMHTLFRSVSGGFDWGATATALEEVHWAWMYLFSAYIAFCMFAVLNVMTGIFCQVAVESSRNDPQFLMHHLSAEKERQTDLIRNLFRIFDRAGRGYIALTELEDKFFDETAQGMMGLLEVYPQSGWSLFKKLDENHDGRLNEEEFVNGIFKLKGVAKSWDIEEILTGQQRLQRVIESHLGPIVARKSARSQRHRVTQLT